MKTQEDEKMYIKPIKYAILSCVHGHATQYIEWNNSPLYELVGVTQAANYQGDHLSGGLPKDVPIYRSEEELYAAHPDLEAVVIGSENSEHARQTIDAANRGLHTISMKVPTLDMDEYRAMMEAVERNHVICMVELEMHRYAGPARVLDLIKSGAIGELQSINIVNYSIHPVWWNPWVGVPEKSYGKAIQLKPNDYRFRGGALTDHAHPMDLVRLMAGADFDTVYANVSPNIREGVVVEEMIHMIGRMKNGVTFSIDPSFANDEHHVSVIRDGITWRKYPKTVEVFMSAVGTKGTIVGDIYNKNTYVQNGLNGEYQCMFEAHKIQGLWPSIETDFYQYVRGEKKELESLRYHMNSMQAVVAAYESVYSGKAVKVDDI